MKLIKKKILVEKKPIKKLKQLENGWFEANKKMWKPDMMLRISTIKRERNCRK